MAMITGIDVSKWQKGFDLKNALNQGFTYYIFRAGNTYNSGKMEKDPQFDNFCNQAKTLNITTWGAYYFGHAFSVNGTYLGYCAAMWSRNLFHTYRQPNQNVRIHVQQNKVEQDQ